MKRLLAALAALSILAAFATSAAPAAAAPVYDVKATWGDTNLPPGGEGQFLVQARNVSEEDGSGNLTVSDELPAGVTVKAVHWNDHGQDATAEIGPCSGVGTETASCVLPGFLMPFFGLGRGTVADTSASPTGYLPMVEVDVEVGSGASGTGTNTATVSGGGAIGAASDVDQVPFDATPSPFGVAPGSFEADFFDREYPAGAPSRTAGDHPFEQRVNFDITSRLTSDSFAPKIVSNAAPKTVEATLPRGLIGNPEALPKCDPILFTEAGSTKNSTACPADTQVGYINILLPQGDLYWNMNALLSRVPLYSLVPPKGQAADLAFSAAGFVQAHIYPVLDPAQNYAIKTLTPDITAFIVTRGAEVTVWGVPGDPAHDKHRYYPEAQPTGEKDEFGHEIKLATGAPFDAAIRPFLTNPADCGAENGGTRFRIDSYIDPGNFTPTEEYGNPDNTEGCEDPRFRFEPKIALQPTDRHAGAPTGLDVHLEVPQRNDEVNEAKELYAEEGFVKGISTPPIKKTVVTFPQGMTISPSAAQGLGSCSLAQIGISPDGVANGDPVSCPDNSQYGRLILHTPILPATAQPEGFIYIARQNENPFHNFLSLYLVIEEPDRGIRIKVPGRVDLDPQTGQITTSFDELPQFPLSDMQMTFKGGVRAALVNPSTCGPKTIAAEFFSWQDPGTPHLVNSSYDVTQRPDGSPCVNNLGERPFAPQLAAGTENNAAGSYSPFNLELNRTDDDQELSQLALTLPPGLLAKIAGIKDCPEAGIAQALARTGAGDGAAEQADPSCPASSLLGSSQVGLGVGVPLTYVPGRLYLAGPYRGAPLSILAVYPAVVGPYDLGVVAVRSAARVDPDSSRITVTTDPFPQIYQGIPVRVRDLRVKVDRPETTLNPTSCAEMQIDAHLTGTGGDVNTSADDSAAELANRFQAADCASLAFKPKLTFKLKGGTHRGDHPAFSSVLRARPGDANIGAAVVALPHSEFLENAHIRTVCTRVQFAADACPPASIYGHARAITPLLDQPVEGDLVLRSSDNPLPDLVARLRGKISANLIGRIDSVNGGIRTSFDAVPDVPVTEFTLQMRGGNKGLFVNSRNLCKAPSRADVRFTAQNGKRLHLRPLMRNGCKKTGRKAKHRHHRRG